MANAVVPLDAPARDMRLNAEPHGLQLGITVSRDDKHVARVASWGIEGGADYTRDGVHVRLAAAYHWTSRPQSRDTLLSEVFVDACRLLYAMPMHDNVVMWHHVRCGCTQMCDDVIAVLQEPHAATFGEVFARWGHLETPRIEPTVVGPFTRYVAAGNPIVIRPWKQPVHIVQSLGVIGRHAPIDPYERTDGPHAARYKMAPPNDGREHVYWTRL